jgi:hypothetical protein
MAATTSAAAIFANCKDTLIEAGVQVYSLGVFDHDYSVKHTPEEIARELRNQYVLGYSPAAMIADGKYHRVNLKLATPGSEKQLHAYYRQGYYAPGQ